MPSAKSHADPLAKQGHSVSYWKVDFNILLWGSVHACTHVQCLLQLVYMQPWQMAHVLSKSPSAIDIPGMGLTKATFVRFQIGNSTRIFPVLGFPFSILFL